MSKYRNGKGLLLAASMLFLMSGVVQGDESSTPNLAPYYKQSMSNLNEGEVKRGMQVAMMYKEQGMLSDAYSQVLFSYHAQTGKITRTRQLFMAGLLAYEMSGYTDPNSYAWRILLDDYSGETLTKQAWKLIERHYGGKEAVPDSLKKK